MSSLSHLAQGFDVALAPTNLMMAFSGAFIGTVVGMLPGLGPINAVAILMPLVFALNFPPETALILLATVYIGCEYGGRISSILLNNPGDSAAAMTTLDGHPMASQGLAGVALSISAWSSFIGAFVATVGMVFIAPLLARWAMAFGPAENMALMVFVLACIAGMVGDRPVKTLLAVLMGFALASIGTDAVSGVQRFTFGESHLAGGVSFIVLVVGLFSLSEIFLMLERTPAGQVAVTQTSRMLFNGKELFATLGTSLRSSVVGFLVGILPGPGATIASSLAYLWTRRLHPQRQFGAGEIRGVVAPEAANNAAACGSFVPMLALGLPGSGTTAVIMGALALYNITPGPQLFEQQGELVWGLVASLFIANLVLLLLNIPLVGAFSRMLSTPLWVLVPAIVAVSAVGVYAVNSHTFDLVLAMLFGVFGYVLRKLGFSLSALVIGFVIAEMFEGHLLVALSTAESDPTMLWQSPTAIVLWGLAAVIAVLPPLWRRLSASSWTSIAHD